MARFIGSILIDDHCADQPAKFDQRVPVASVARQARRLDRKHGTDATFTDRCEQLLEARTAHARTRAAKIVIDDRHIGPAESTRTVGKAILTPPALMIVSKLVDGGLPDIDEGAARKMVRRDLHRLPPSLRRCCVFPIGARSPMAIASSARPPPPAAVGSWARRGRIGGDMVGYPSCVSPPSRQESSRSKLRQA